MEFNETLGFNHGGFFLSDWRRLRANGGPALLEKCCHDIDLVHWLLGSRPQRVASFGGLNFFLPANASLADKLGHDALGKPAYRTWPSTTGLNPFCCDKDIEDNQVAILEFQNHVRATFHYNANAGIPERRMYLVAEKGAIRADLITGRIEVGMIGFDTAIKEIQATNGDPHGMGDDIMARELIDNMVHHTPPRCGLEQGMAAVVTCLGIDQSMREGRIVDIPEIF